MVIPDFELICEIMLVAEGFIDARLLARKFISLYTLCRELLSKQVGGIPYLTYSIQFYTFNPVTFYNCLCLKDCSSYSSNYLNTFLVIYRTIMTGVWEQLNPSW